MEKRVIVAMSGGIDSNVATALLKRQGFEVIGLFMRMVAIPRFKKGEEVARKTAKALNVPFYTLDLEKEFKKKIIDSFLLEYKRGRTPNPCVVCNREIKFEFLLKEKANIKADFVATGHYTRLQKKRGRINLLRGRDKEKDQSYFLWQLKQKQLKHIIFPLGNYAKKQVRNFAIKYKLPIFDVPESQEVCFIQATTDDFLRRQLKTKKGRIVDTQDKEVGEHSGLPFYTIGQRKGIGIPGGPYYVLKKDLRNNVLVVTKNEKDLLGNKLTAKMINWISDREPKFPLKVKVKIRYRHKAVSTTIFKKKNNYKLVFAKPQRAITPGQSVVFYRGEELLGGGIIS